MEHLNTWVKIIASFTTSALMSGCTTIELSNSDSADLAQIEKPVVLSHDPVDLSSDWQLVWEDEFDGEQINRRNWSLEVNCWGGGNNEQQCYTDDPSNAFVKDGFLHIVALKQSYTGPDNAEGALGGAMKTLPFTSARLSSKSKRDTKYGRYEIRAKLPGGQGAWPAIWMLPTENKYGTWAASGEIDIMEAVNLNTPSDEAGRKSGDLENRIYGTLHYGRNWPNNVYKGQPAILPDDMSHTDGFHTYAIEWEEGQLENASGAAPFDEKFHVLLNLAIGGSWSANANEKGIDEGLFPKTMLVDSVKVYRCKVDRWKGKGCASRSEYAKQVIGHEAPKILTSDDSYSHGPTLDIFTDILNTSLSYASYDPLNVVSYQEINEPGRGTVLQVIKNEGSGNIYFRSPETDVTHWQETGELVFDLKVESVSDGVELLVKMDSGWPKTSDYTVPLSPIGEWKTERIPIADILNNDNRFASGNQADPKMITNLLVFEPQGKMSFKLDNIRFEK